MSFYQRNKNWYKEYYKQNKNRINELRRKRRAANPEPYRVASRRQWRRCALKVNYFRRHRRATDPNIRAREYEQYRKYKAAHPNYEREYYQKNKDRINQRRRAWRASHRSLKVTNTRHRLAHVALVKWLLKPIKQDKIVKAKIVKPKVPKAKRYKFVKDPTIKPLLDWALKKIKPDRVKAAKAPKLKRIKKLKPIKINPKIQPLNKWLFQPVKSPPRVKDPSKIGSNSRMLSAMQEAYRQIR